MLWFSFLVAAVAAPTVGLLPEDGDPPLDPGVDPEVAPLVGGGPAPAGNDDVVGLAFYDEATELLTVFCTGSVIQDDWILTAAHCIEETQQVQGVPGLQRVAVWGENIPALGATEIIAWREAFVSPIYNAGAFTGDAGLVQLVKPHPDPTWVVLRDEVYDATQVGAQVDVYGYGATGDGRGDSGVKRTTTLAVEEVDGSNIMTFTPGANVCSGDSGGPGFAATAWGREQVGINAFVTPGCIGGRGGSTRVDVHIDWILDHVPGVALDPSQLPRDDEDEDDEGGGRRWNDFGGDEAQIFAVGLEDVDPVEQTGCATAPVTPWALLGLLPVALRRRRNRASPNSARP